MKEIPFFPNHPDGTHCYQSALKMILAHFTGKQYSFEELDRLTGKLEGKWTWPTASFLWLLDEGFELRLIEEFSYEEFAAKGKEYLLAKCGAEVAGAQELHSDLPREQALAKQLLVKKPNVKMEVPTWKDLKELFNDGYLIICNINSNILSHHPGYSGHFVVPTEVGEQTITFHDPGLPPKPSQTIDRKTFEKAWGYPTRREKNILAIKKPNNIA